MVGRELLFSLGYERERDDAQSTLRPPCALRLSVAGLSGVSGLFLTFRTLKLINVDS